VAAAALRLSGLASSSRNVRSRPIARPSTASRPELSAHRADVEQLGHAVVGGAHDQGGREREEDDGEGPGEQQLDHQPVLPDQAAHDVVLGEPEPRDDREAEQEAQEVDPVRGQQLGDRALTDLGADLDQRQHEQRDGDGHDASTKVRKRSRSRSRSVAGAPYVARAAIPLRRTWSR
jgi:hypothetical protein